MSWLSSLFGSASPPRAISRHLGLLVGGTLLHAESAVRQVKMQRIEGMTGIASVFGMPEGLQAQTREGRWVALSELAGRWILVIPEDAYVRYQSEFDRALEGKPVDGRVKSTGAAGGFAFSTVNQQAVDRLVALIARMPPLSEIRKVKSRPLPP